MRNGGTAARIEGLAAACLSAERRLHSQGAAELARELCGRFGEDGDKGEAAGLGHDLAREMSPGEIMRLGGSDGLPVSGAEAREPILLHGRAAAVLLERHAGIRDPEVLQAVLDHVTGRPGMGRLSKILFCADLLERRRDFLSPRHRARLLGLELDAMTLAVLRIKVQYVRSRKEAAGSSSSAFMEELIRNAG